MASLCYRRPSGQHFLVFFDSVSQAIVHISKLDIQNFELVDTLHTFLTIGPDEERFVGSSDELQLVLTCGHVGPQTSGCQAGRWPEHFVIVDKAHITKVLESNAIYGWPENQFSFLGPFKGILEPIGPSYGDLVVSPDNYFVLPKELMAY